MARAFQCPKCGLSYTGCVSGHEAFCAMHRALQRITEHDEDGMLVPMADDNLGLSGLLSASKLARQTLDKVKEMKSDDA